jgi:hypothetical protein
VFCFRGKVKNKEIHNATSTFHRHASWKTFLQQRSSSSSTLEIFTPSTIQQPRPQKIEHKTKSTIMALQPIAHNAQVQKLTTALKNICRDYPAGGTVLRELLQNADDAGATEVVSNSRAPSLIYQANSTHSDLFSMREHTPRTSSYTRSLLSIRGQLYLHTTTRSLHRRTLTASLAWEIL